MTEALYARRLAIDVAPYAPFAAHMRAQRERGEPLPEPLRRFLVYHLFLREPIGLERLSQLLDATYKNRSAPGAEAQHSSSSAMLFGVLALQDDYACAAAVKLVFDINSLRTPKYRADAKPASDVPASEVQPPMLLVPPVSETAPPEPAQALAWSDDPLDSILSPHDDDADPPSSLRMRAFSPTIDGDATDTGSGSGSGSSAGVGAGAERATPESIVVSPHDPTRFFSMDDSLRVERQLYRDVVAKLLLLRVTPHLVAPLANVRFEKPALFWSDVRAQGDTRHARTLRTLLTRETLHEYARSYEYVNGHPMGENEGRVWLGQQTLAALVLENCAGETLHAYCVRRAAEAGREPRKRYDGEWRAIAFQLVYTLAALAEVGLAHNDLHTGNIFVERRSAPVLASYVIDDYTVYYVHSRVCLKIYDWDMATKMSSPYAPQEIVNHGLAARDLCAQVGACHHPERRRYVAPFFDAFTVLTLLHSSTSNVLLRAFIERVIDSEWLAQAATNPSAALSYPNRACWRQDGADGSGANAGCRPIARADVAGASRQTRKSPTRMQTPRAALSDPYFSRLLALPSALPSENYALCSYATFVLAPGAALFGD